MGLRDKLKQFGGRSGPIRDRLTREEMREVMARLQADPRKQQRTEDTDAEEMFRAAEENASARPPVDATLTPGNPEEVEYLARGDGDGGEMEDFVLASEAGESSDEDGFCIGLDCSGLFGGDE